jgi:hypothetical protein
MRSTGARGQRHEQSRVRGRQQTPAEVVASRMLILKHVRNWSYETLEREVRVKRGVSQLLSDRDGEGAGRQDAGSAGTGGWTPIPLRNCTIASWH